MDRLPAIVASPPANPATSPVSRRRAMTMIELIVVLAMLTMLSTAIYAILYSVRKSFSQSQSKMDILQTTRVIMAKLRTELRNAVDKPQVINDRLYIQIAPDTAWVYYYDAKLRRLFMHRNEGRSEELLREPDVGQMKPYAFDDGQILRFDFDSSYRDSNAFAESELTLNSKVWFKVTMKILYSEKFRQLSDEDKKKILADDNDPRVKTFFMMITPRKVNWLLQGTQ